jgi:hypothetical protein
MKQAKKLQRSDLFVENKKSNKPKSYVGADLFVENINQSSQKLQRSDLFVENKKSIKPKSSVGAICL